MNRIVVAIDGPAGAGKSTISKIVADKLGIEYIDTGAMYRAVTLKLLRENAIIGNDADVKRILKDTDVYFVESKIYLNGEDVSSEIRQLNVSSRVSDVAAMQCVREKLVELQRKMAASKNVIMDGRDIGTNVLKNANFKIYLTASVEERAKRRYKELCEKNKDILFEDICRDIQNRDNIDMNREINPLVKAEDAVLVETTGKGIDGVVNEILTIINKG